MLQKYINGAKDGTLRVLDEDSGENEDSSSAEEFEDGVDDITYSEEDQQEDTYRSPYNGEEEDDAQEVAPKRRK